MILKAELTVATEATEADATLQLRQAMSRKSRTKTQLKKGMGDRVQSHLTGD